MNSSGISKLAMFDFRWIGVGFFEQAIRLAWRWRPWRCSSLVAHPVHQNFWVVSLWMEVLLILHYCGWLQNPAAVDRRFIPLFIGFQPSFWWCRISQTIHSRSIDEHPLVILPSHEKSRFWPVNHHELSTNGPLNNPFSSRSIKQRDCISWIFNEFDGSIYAWDVCCREVLGQVWSFLFKKKHGRWRKPGRFCLSESHSTSSLLRNRWRGVLGRYGWLQQCFGIWCPDPSLSRSQAARSFNEVSLLSHYHSWLAFKGPPKDSNIFKFWCKVDAKLVLLEAFLGGSARISASVRLRLASWSDSILP